MKPILIIVAGGSASGKTTVVDKIVKMLNSKDVILIKHDDYYKANTNLSKEEKEKINYDHPFSLENDLLLSHLKSLLNYESINKPIYDFVESKRLDKTILTNPAKIIILEGILTLENKEIRDLSSLNIFVESDDDIRFIRRLKRDTIERGRSIESVINQYLTTVKPMYYEFVKPSKRYADVIIPNHDKHDAAVDVIIAKLNAILNEGSN